MTIVNGDYMKQEIPIWEKANLTIVEASKYSNIGQNKLSELMKAPKCPFVLYVGRKKLVKRKKYKKFINQNVVL